MENKKNAKTKKNVGGKERSVYQLNISMENCQDDVTCSDDTGTIGILFPRDTKPYNK